MPEPTPERDVALDQHALASEGIETAGAEGVETLVADEIIVVYEIVEVTEELTR